MVRLPALICLALAASACAHAQSLKGLLDSLDAVHRFREVAISPDGKRLAWVDGEKIFVDSKRLTSSPEHCAESGGTWSPDSSTLAYLSNCGNEGQLQLYLARDGGTRQLTKVKGFVQGPRWSPDGRSIAILYTENAPRAAGPLEAVTAANGVVEEKIFYQRLAIIGVAADLHAVSPADMYVYEFDWAPGSDKLVYTAAPGPGDNNWYIAQIYTIGASGGPPRSVVKPSMQVAVPRWSPDGKAIAFIGGVMSDEGSTGGDIYTIPAEGGEPRDVTPQIHSSPDWLSWMPSSREILFTEELPGTRAAALLNLANGQTELLWHPDDSFTAGVEGGLSVAQDHKTAALIMSSWDRAPEIWSGPIGAPRQVTSENAHAPRSWGTARSLKWKSDNFDVQGWLLFPAEYDAKRHYPMIVAPHGGPAAQKRPGWPDSGFDLSLLAPRGYFVFYPNPRGSYGQGEVFTRANVKDFGHGDLRDILSGVDQVLKEFPIDPDRIGISGWSYGGYMTMWAVTQTHRFRAAVAGAGLSNWQSYYGENAIDQWMTPYFGASVYDDPAVYAKSSPINFIKNVQTPTLVVVGDSDGECPPPQSYEFWHALKTLGVKTQMVVYEHEGHRFRLPEHRRDVIERTVRWFDENMPAKTQRAAVQ